MDILRLIRSWAGIWRCECHHDIPVRGGLGKCFSEFSKDDGVLTDYSAHWPDM